MNDRRVQGTLVSVLVGVWVLALLGCVTSPPVRLYILTALSEQPTSAAGSRGTSDPALGVGPVTLPQYLDRPQIVSRTTAAWLAVAEFEQWAAPLQDDFARVLAENLAIQVPTDRVAIFPWSRSTLIDYQVLVEATRFDADASGEVVLLARWRLLDVDGRELAMQRTRLAAEVAPPNPAEDGSPNYEAVVAAMSRVLEMLGAEIATALRTVAGQEAAR